MRNRGIGHVHGVSMLQRGEARYLPNGMAHPEAARIAAGRWARHQTGDAQLAPITGTRAAQEFPMTVELPEVRTMVAAAKQYVAGEIHFSQLVGPIERCEFWARVHGVHPAIRQLAAEWKTLVDQTWNEWGQHPVRLSEAELRRRIAADLGVLLIP